MTNADEPIALFEEWFTEAGRLEPGVPDAAALATVGADGRVADALAFPCEAGIN